MTADYAETRPEPGPPALISARSRVTDLITLTKVAGQRAGGRDDGRRLLHGVAPGRSISARWQ